MTTAAEPAVAVEYLTRWFGHPAPLMLEYSDGQIAQGLTYLVSTSASGDNEWLPRPTCRSSIASAVSKR
jgi:hypothetical protein